MTGQAQEVGFNKNLESESVRLLEAVGILDVNDEFVQNESVTITRAEMARLLVCAMGYREEANKMTEFESLYKDVKVKTKYANEIILASKWGLFGEDLSDYFYPENPAKTDWAFKAMARLLGYSQQLKTDSLTVHRLDLDKNIEIDRTKNLSRVGAIQLLKNAIEVPVLRVTGVTNEGVVYEKSDNRTILTEYFKIDNRLGCLTADAHTAVKGARTEVGKIAFDETVYFVDEALSTNDLVGMQCRYYFKNTDNRSVVIYIEKQPAKEMILYSKNMEYNYDENCYYLHKDGRSERFRMDIHTMVSYNGDPYFDRNLMHPLAGHVVMIDNDLDGTYEVCKIREYRNIAVKSCDVEGKRIFDLTDASRNLDLEPYDEVVIYSESGDVTDISGITPNSVLTVYESIDRNRLEIYVTARSIARNLNKINSSKNILTIDGTDYRISADCLFNLADMSAGKMYYFYINYWNEVVYVRENSAYIALWYLAATPNDGVFNQTFTIKGMSETGEIMYLELAERLIWNSYELGREGLKATDAYRRLTTGTPNKRMIKVGLDEYGKISEIVVAYDAQTRADLMGMTKEHPLIRMSYIVNEWPDYALYRTDATTGAKYAYFYGDHFNQWLYFDAGAVEFHVPTDTTQTQHTDEDMFVRGFRYGSTDQRDISTFDVYMSSKDGVAAEYIVKDLDDPREQYLSSEGYFAAPAIVTGIETCLDEEGYQEVCKISIIDRTGWAGELYTVSKDVINRPALEMAGAVLPAGKSSLEIGDLISYEANQKGKIEQIRLVYDAKSETGTYPQTAMNVTVGCNYGDVIRSKNGYMEYNANGGGITSPVVLSANIGRYLIEYDEETEKARAITPDNVYAGDRVVVLSRYASVYMVVVYRAD